MRQGMQMPTASHFGGKDIGIIFQIMVEQKAIIKDASGMDDAPQRNPRRGDLAKHLLHLFRLGDIGLAHVNGGALIAQHLQLGGHGRCWRPPAQQGQVARATGNQPVRHR